MGRNILVVEDDKNISDLIHMYLVKEGFDVRIAGDGGKALEEFQKKEPDLILLDLNLPGQDGMELLIDGAAGELIAQPDEETLVQFAEKKAKDDERRAMLAAFRDRPGETSDGRRIIIEGNIGTPGDAVRVMELGGEGVGLFRSEFLFMDRTDLPSEEEQFAARFT